MNFPLPNSGSSQTSFDQVFITICFMWLLTPKSLEKQMTVANICKQDKAAQFPQPNENQVLWRSLISLCMRGV